MRKRETDMARYIKIQKELPPVVVKTGRPKRGEEIGSRIDRGASGPRANVQAITGQRMSGDARFAVWRKRMQPRMMELYLDPKNGMNYELIAREMNSIARAEGVPEFVMTKGMVMTDVKAGLKDQMAKVEGERDAVFSAATSALSEVIRASMEDYEKSKGVDAKSEASMLRTLMMSGMKYEEAMDKIAEKRYAGDPDHLRVMMDAVGRLAGMHGVSMKELGQAAMSQGQGSQQQSGNIVNYNFGQLPKDLMGDMVRKLQDAKFESMREDAPKRASESDIEEQND